MLTSHFLLQANALNCLKARDLTVFTDIINNPDQEAGNDFPLPDDHWINQTISEEDDKTLLTIALEDGLVDLPRCFSRSEPMPTCTTKSLAGSPSMWLPNKGTTRS